MAEKAHVVADMPIEQAKTILCLIEDVINDEEIETCWMNDQKEHLKDFFNRFQYWKNLH